MENAKEFQNRLDAMLNKAVRDLAIDDATIAYKLLSRAVAYLCIEYKSKPNEDFDCWLDELLRDGRKKLKMGNLSLCDILLARGTHYYLKVIGKRYLSNP